MASLIRKCARVDGSWNRDDLDLGFQIVQWGYVADDFPLSADSREHFLQNGFAIRRGAEITLTLRGVIHFFVSPVVWMDAFRFWRMWRRNPFVSDEILLPADQIGVTGIAAGYRPEPQLT